MKLHDPVVVVVGDVERAVVVQRQTGGVSDGVGVVKIQGGLPRRRRYRFGLPWPRPHHPTDTPREKASSEKKGESSLYFAFDLWHRRSKNRQASEKQTQQDGDTQPNHGYLQSTDNRHHETFHG
ncbi:MAG: hypothetical protein VYA67_11600 [Actinomycetota bacterium]|nr:hypothetical protein [Actinomycetota bacterium]